MSAENPAITSRGAAAAAPALDAMTVRVLGGAFGAIAKEMAQVIFRTAFFQIIREAEDLGAGLYTHDGQEIAESETTAMHCGSIGSYLRGIREIWGDDIAPGDVFLHNDPHALPVDARAWTGDGIGAGGMTLTVTEGVLPEPGRELL